MRHKVIYDDAQDVELWLFKGEGWVLPCYRRTCTVDSEPFYHMRSAVPFGYAQVRVLGDLIETYGGMKASVGWMLPAESLEKIATRAPGITPEFYFTWEDRQPRKPKPLKDTFIDRIKRDQVQAEEFLQHVSDRTGVDRSTVSIVWLAITQTIPEWILGGRRLDLGICKLVAIPYRHDWKELLLAKYPELNKVLLLKDPRRFLSLAFTHLSRALRIEGLTQFHASHSHSTFGWTIEVLHDSSWEKTVKEVERSHASKLGPASYIKRWANRVAQLEETIYEILAQKIAKANLSCCSVRRDSRSGSPRFVQASPFVLGVPEVVDGDPGCGRCIDDHTGLADTSAYLEEKAARLLEMSTPNQALDVRVQGGDGARNPHDDGMLVLPTTGGTPPKETVLAQRDGNSKSLE